MEQTQKTSLQALIFNVLKVEMEGTNQFLSNETIAYRCIIMLHERNMTLRINNLISPIDVRQRMSLVRKYAIQHDIVVVADRMPTQNDPEKRSHVRGWKIAKAEDALHIAGEVQYRSRTAVSNIKSGKKIIRTGVETGIIEPNVINIQLGDELPDLALMS